MSSRVNRLRVTLEPLESRNLLSTLPVNTLDVVNGNVATPGAKAEVSTPVTAHNINGKSSIVIGESITPAPGSTLEPTFIAAYGPNGQRLHVQRGAPFVPGVHGSVTVFVTVTTPGPVSTVVGGAHGTTGAFQLREYLPGDILGTGQVTIADLAAFAPHYLQQVGDPLYDPAADANLNGQIGMGDARYIERNMAPLTPPVRPFVSLHLAPGEQVPHPSVNLGGEAYQQNVTIIGHTIPGALVISDSPAGDYTFTGPVLPTNAQGEFSQNVTLTSGFNNFDFLVIDQYGRQIMQDFPIVWSAYAEPHSPYRHGG